MSDIVSNTKQIQDYAENTFIHASGDSRIGSLALSGSLTLSGSELHLLSSNFRQTTGNENQVVNYSPRNSFIQAEHDPAYGVACTGSRGYCILSVCPDISALKLSGDISQLAEHFDDMFSIVLSNAAEVHNNQLTATDGQLAYYSQRPSESILKLSSLTEEEMVRLWHDDDNALFFFEHPEAGNQVVQMFVGGHAEGCSTKAIGKYSHAEGRDNVTNKYAHAEGQLNRAYGVGSHAEGCQTRAFGNYAHVEGNQTIAYGQYSHAEACLTRAIGEYAHAEGYQTSAYGNYSHASGEKTQALGKCSFAEGRSSVASGSFSHAEGQQTSATGDHTHAEGLSSQAIGSYSSAQGYNVSAFGECSHAEGYLTLAFGSFSHAEGNRAKAGAEYSHSEGYNTSANGMYSHAEGNAAVATGMCSHAEGAFTKALNDYSHAEGYNTSADGMYSHAEGAFTNALNAYEHACGEYNKSVRGMTLFTVGNGNQSSRKNAFEVHKDGDAAIGGNISSGEGKTSGVGVGWNGSAIVEAQLSGTQAAAFSAGASLGERSFAANKGTANSKNSAAFGTSFALGSYSFVHGAECSAFGYLSHAEGQKTVAGNKDVLENSSERQNHKGAHAEGMSTTAYGQFSHAEGDSTFAKMQFSHAEGLSTYAGGTGSHSEGSQTSAFGDISHSEGLSCIASGYASHAEGMNCIAALGAAHVEGWKNIASQRGNFSHVEGVENKAYGENVHIEGWSNEADSGCDIMHIEGAFNKALSSSYSHIEGFNNTLSGSRSHVAGINTDLTANYAFAWNGVSSTTYMRSGCDGTFNINPKGGTKGLFIGDTSLDELLSEQNCTSFKVWANDTEIPVCDRISDIDSISPLMRDVYGEDVLSFPIHEKIPVANVESLTFRSTSSPEKFTCIIDWGDGTIQHLRDLSYPSASQQSDYWKYTVEHTYQYGTYEVKAYANDCFGLMHEDSSKNLVHDAFYKGSFTAACLLNSASMFKGAKRLLKVDAGYVYPLSKGIVNTSSMFEGCSNLHSVKDLSLGDSVVHMASMFKGCTSLKDCSIQVPSTVHGAGYAFEGCESLESNVEDIICKRFNGPVVALHHMFKGCKKLNGTVPAHLLWKDSMVDVRLTMNDSTSWFAFEGCPLSSQVPANIGGGDTTSFAHVGTASYEDIVKAAMPTMSFKLQSSEESHEFSVPAMSYAADPVITFDGMLCKRKTVQVDDTETHVLAVNDSVTALGPVLSSDLMCMRSFDASNAAMLSSLPPRCFSFDADALRGYAQTTEQISAACAAVLSGGLKLPEGIKTIRGNFIAFTGVRSLRVPEGVTTIETQAFAHAKFISKYVIPRSVQTIGTNAFGDQGTYAGENDLFLNKHPVTIMFEGRTTDEVMSLYPKSGNVAPGYFNDFGVLRLDCDGGKSLYYTSNVISAITEVESSKLHWSSSAGRWTAS